MCKILIESDLLCASKKIKFIKANLHHIENCITLELPLSEFLDFCCNNGVKIVFYCYEYYDKEKYFITDTIIRENTENEKAYLFCKRWADKRNIQISQIDFERPRELTLISLFEGFIIKYNIVDVWMEDDLEDAYAALSNFLFSHEEKMMSFYEYSEDKNYKNPYDLLVEKLLADKNFRHCTNKEMRRTYISDFLKNEDNKKYLLLFKGVKENLEREYRLKQLFDRIYEEYRKNCYRLKIPVGDPLPSEEKSDFFTNEV